MTGTFHREEVAPEELRGSAHRMLQRPGWRFGHLTARELAPGSLVVELLLLDTGRGGGEILTAPLRHRASSYPSVTTLVPAAHWAERALGDFFGLEAEGHPRWKSTRPQRAPASSSLTSLLPFDQAEPFLEVQGEGVHEIPVGPIHAGIIEPGHFRFSCVGEQITNLEIRLGYQHRGVERALGAAPLPRLRFLAEAASSDTAVGNALAHAVAIERLAGLEPPPRAGSLRTLALEVERLASHVGDLGGLSADIGFSAGAAIFGRLRGGALGLAELLAGNRLQRAFILPGGVARDLPAPRLAEFRARLSALAAEVEQHVPMLLEHPAVMERMEGTGRLKPSLAREFGLVGPAARASGGTYDARSVYLHGLFPPEAPAPARGEAGDVLARARVRGEEIAGSMALLERVSGRLPDSAVRTEWSGSLAPDAVGIGIVEAWRGELIHWITTDAGGRVQRYAIKDPSFNNWTGLAIAVRGNLVADFPLCNKSFNLSYSGHDL